ncbi:MAG: response regulator, partial [Lachnospiraceae bacterium]|nr:response regulator [Lachnospiraceae bacterium]
ELLKKTEVVMDTADSGNKAIELCRSNKYDLILLDHRMPQPDGIETFKVISHEGMNTDTPVIMLTANALSGVEEEYLNLGFAGYLSKPVRVAELEEMLARLLPAEKVKLRV